MHDEMTRSRSHAFGAGANEEIPKRNLRDGVAARLRRMIFDGSFARGEKLSQDLIATQFGVSKLPVREALLILGEEGLVLIKPRRGAFIAELEPVDIQVHFEIIGAIARLTARRAAVSIEDDKIAELWDLHKAMLDAEDPSVLGRLNYDFHRIINHACGSTRLLAQISFLSKSIPPEFFETEGWAETANGHHEQIIRALEARDAEVSGDLMDMHLSCSGIYATRRLTESGFFDRAEPSRAG